MSQNINNLKTISQYDVKNISVIQNKISNFSDRRKLKETIELLNITTKNNIINPTVFKVTNSSQKKVLQENIQNINIFESGKNATVINKLSFESNKKNITNLVSDLNIVNNNIEKKDEKLNQKDNSKKMLDNHLLELENEYNTLFNRMNKRRQELVDEEINKNYLDIMKESISKSYLIFTRKTKSSF